MERYVPEWPGIKPEWVDMTPEWRLNEAVIPVAFRRDLGSLQYISARSGIFLRAGIFIHTFEERITNFTPRSGWSRCRRQRVHPRATDYLLGGFVKASFQRLYGNEANRPRAFGIPWSKLGYSVGAMLFFLPVNHIDISNRFLGLTAFIKLVKLLVGAVCVRWSLKWQFSD